MRPPRIKVPGRGQGRNIPKGYLLGRDARGRGDIELLDVQQFIRKVVSGNANAQTILEYIAANPPPPSPTTAGASAAFSLLESADSEEIWPSLSVAASSGSGGSSSGSWIPLVSGTEPPTFITDGAGVLVTVAYSP